MPTYNDHNQYKEYYQNLRASWDEVRTLIGLGPNASDGAVVAQIQKLVEQKTIPLGEQQVQQILNNVSKAVKEALNATFS